MSAKLKIKRGLLSSWNDANKTVSLEPGQLGIAYLDSSYTGDRKSPMLKVGGGETGTETSTWSDSKLLNADPYLYSDGGVRRPDGSVLLGWGEEGSSRLPFGKSSTVLLLGTYDDTVHTAYNLTNNGTFYASSSGNSTSLGVEGAPWGSSYAGNAYFNYFGSVGDHGLDPVYFIGPALSPASSKSSALGATDSRWTTAYFNRLDVSDESVGAEQRSKVTIDVDEPDIGRIISASPGRANLSLEAHSIYTDEGYTEEEYVIRTALLVDGSQGAVYADSSWPRITLGTADNPWYKTFTQDVTYASHLNDYSVITDYTQFMTLTASTPSANIDDVYEYFGWGTNGTTGNLTAGVKLTGQWRYMYNYPTGADTDSLYEMSLVFNPGQYMSGCFYPETNGYVNLGKSDAKFNSAFFSTGVIVGSSVSTNVNYGSSGISRSGNPRSSISSNTDDMLTITSMAGSWSNPSAHYLRGGVSISVNSKYSTNSTYTGYLNIVKDTVQSSGGVIISSNTGSTSTSSTAKLSLQGSTIEFTTGSIVPMMSGGVMLGASNKYFYDVYSLYGTMISGLFLPGSSSMAGVTDCSKISGHSNSFTDNGMKYQGLTIVGAPPGTAAGSSTSPYLNNTIHGVLAIELYDRSVSLYNGAYKASNTKSSILFEGHAGGLGVYPELDTVGKFPSSYLGNLMKPWAAISTQNLNISDSIHTEGIINNCAQFGYYATGGEWGNGCLFLYIDSPSSSIDTCPVVMFDADNSGHIWIHTNETGTATSTGGGGASSAMLYFGSNTNLARNVYTELVCVNQKVYPMSNDTATLGSSGARWKEVWCKTSSCTTSDRREKDSIKYLDDGDAAVTREQVVDFVKKMRPTTFVLKHSDVDVATEENSPDSYIQIGFIAQDLEDIDAKMFQRVGSKAPVVEGEDNVPTGEVTYSLQDLPLTATAIVAIQEVMRENEELKARLAAIEEKLSKL